MDKKYSCTICNKQYSTPSSLSNHKKIYHIEVKKVTNEYPCRYCDKSYTIYQSRWIHEQTCKTVVKETSMEKILEEVKQLKKEILLKDKVIAAQDTVIKSNDLNTKTFKAVNNVLMRKIMNSHNTTINNHNNILQIYNIGMENVVETITQKQKIQIMNAGHTSFNKLIETVHCSEYDQFKNIIITNLKGDIAYVYDSNKGYFVQTQLNDALEEIYRCRIYDLEEIYNEMKDETKITEKTKKIIKDFIEKCESEEPYVDEYGKKYPNFKEYNKYSMKIILYKSNEQLKNDIANVIGEHTQVTINE